MSCRGECTGRQGTYRHVRTCVDNPNRVPVTHDLTVTESDDGDTGVVVYSWRCSCGVYGMEPTERDVRIVHGAHTGLRRMSSKERAARHVVTIVKGGGR